MVNDYGQIEKMEEKPPPSVEGKPASWLGCMAGTGRIIGDIVSPASEDSDWNVLRG